MSYTRVLTDYIQLRPTFGAGPEHEIEATVARSGNVTRGVMLPK